MAPAARPSRRRSTATTALDRAPPVPPAAPAGAALAARPARPRRSRRGPLLLLLALLLVVGRGVGAWWFGWARYTADPGRARPDADGRGRQKLEAAGLDVEVGDTAYSETVPAGRVLDDRPGAGDRVLDGGTVDVVLSLGKERYDVPQLAGCPRTRPRTRCSATHLDLRQGDREWSETVPEGTVLRSDPPAGTTLRPGAVVDLVVSKGRKPIQVRDWTGKDADRAEARARAARASRSSATRRSTPTPSPRAT